MSTALGIRSPGGSGVDGNPNGAVVARGGVPRAGLNGQGRARAQSQGGLSFSVGMSCCARGTAGSPSRNAYEAYKGPWAEEMARGPGARRLELV